MARFGLFAFLAVWVVLLAGGFQRVLAHSAEAGADGDAPGSWPEASALQRANDRAELVMLVHPRCPCTIASLRELARLTTRLGERVHTSIVIQVPTEARDGWEGGEAWRLARAIPGANVVADPGGVESARFGAATSGHVVMYSKTGRLLFSGGITPGRGHEGAAQGQEAIF